MDFSKRRKNVFLLFTSAILFLSILVGCGPSPADLAAVDYTPQRGDDWEVSTPEEQEIDPMLVAELYSTRLKWKASMGCW